MPMQFRSFDEASTWYQLRAQIKTLLCEKGNIFPAGKNEEAISVNDAAAILTSYLYGPSQQSANNTFGL